MGGGAGGANGLGDINNDFTEQLQAMIRQAVAEGMAGAGADGAEGVPGADANGLPGLDANGVSGMGGHAHGGRGGMGGAGGAGGHGGMGMGGHIGGAGGGMGGGMRRKKRGMGGAGAGAGGAKGGYGKKKAGGAGGAGKKAKGATATPPDCTKPENAALPDCATPPATDTGGGSDSGFAYAYAAGTPGGIGLPGQAGGVGVTGLGGIPNRGLGGRGRRPFRSYQAEDMGYPEESYGDDEDDYFRAYNTGNTFDLNMPTNPISSTAYGNTRYDKMTPFKVVTA